MNDLQNALIKAKLASEKQIPKISVETKKNERQKNFSKEQPVKLAALFDPFENLYNNEKSKQFVIHILHAFLPFADNTHIYSWEDKEKWKNGKKCCICGLETLSKDDIFQNIDKYASTTMECLTRTFEEGFNVNEFLHEKKKEIFGGRLIGVTSGKTSCVLCNPCYELFTNWVSTKMLSYNTEFHKLTNHIRRTSLIKEE